MKKKSGSIKTQKMKPSEKIQENSNKLNTELDREYIDNLKKQLHFMTLEMEVL